MILRATSPFTASIFKAHPICKMGSYIQRCPELT